MQRLNKRPRGAGRDLLPVIWFILFIFFPLSCMLALSIMIAETAQNPMSGRAPIRAHIPPGRRLCLFRNVGDTQDLVTPGIFLYPKEPYVGAKNPENPDYYQVSGGAQLGGCSGADPHHPGQNPDFFLPDALEVLNPSDIK